MRVRILGSAAGGGFPQWNCNCATCSAARDPGALATSRTQSSIAVRAENGPWFLINASPDLRQQLAELPGEPNGELRDSRVAGILLTDAEIDHTAGLLLMRESNHPLEIYSSEQTRQALSVDYPVLTMLERYCGVRWSALEPGAPVVLGGALEVEAFPTGGDVPLYVDGDDGPTALGLTITDRETGGILTYAPALEEIDDEIAERFARSDAVFVDGTFWTAEELVELGLAKRNAYAMGHMPLSGADGSLATLEALPARTVLVHINNTNPILIEDSPERAIVDASGIDVGYDGMEVEL
ncbi:MAG TPA: pyrroloquinoline quinone biosynthesis protein PqqB [Gaiellaceae bacterium]|nr:pyrroloquinoline quinone biosynthesis protein PqqB [Gaiellaceae bacterium]